MNARPRAVSGASSLVIVALVAACSSSGTPAKVPTHPAAPLASTSAGSPESVGSDAASILHDTFVGRQLLASGHGQLRPAIGNTLAATPANVLSLTFAFVCTGGGKATIRIRVDGKDVPASAGVASCDKSVFQQSVALAKPALVGYEASVDAHTGGTFGYAYFVEKKQFG